MGDQGLEEMLNYFDRRAATYEERVLSDPALKGFYRLAAECLTVSAECPRILDLGCGTGLETGAVFERFPDASVTGIDLSSGMLEELRKKFRDKRDRLTLLCGSYFDEEFGENFDGAISTYSLHHFSAEKKRTVYEKLYASLKPGGVYVEGDCTARTVEEQNFRIAESEKIRRERRAEEGFFHYDTPLTAGNQINLLKRAGFREVKLVRRWEHTALFTARK